MKDVKLSNIDMSGFLPPDARWVASQLQIIKDRGLKDVITGKSLCTKVFPQIDGVPIYNKSGKYTVKLYFMGKERKIEIDDKMPIDFKGNVLFPKSVKKEELWATIITKAIFKMLSLQTNFENFDGLIGSGLVMYSLTGMVSQTISTLHLQDQWKFISSLLNEQHFNSKDIVVSAYCKNEHQPIAPSNKNFEQKDYVIDAVKNPRISHSPIEESDEEREFQKEESKEPVKEPEKKLFSSPLRKRMTSFGD